MKNHKNATRPDPHQLIVSAALAAIQDDTEKAIDVALAAHKAEEAERLARKRQHAQRGALIDLRRHLREQEKPHLIGMRLAWTIIRSIPDLRLAFPRHLLQPASL